jgi:hypothetical protein
LEELSRTSTDNALAPIAMEWNGTIASSTPSGAQFALYLAMHVSRSSEHIQWQQDDGLADNVAEQLNALNHYRRSAFSASERSVNNHRNQAQLRADNKEQSAWLLECMHPTPIHFRDDAKFIDESVHANCPMRTHLSLSKPDAAPAEIEQDPTLLVDIVPASQNML